MVCSCFWRRLTVMDVPSQKTKCGTFCQRDAFVRVGQVDTICCKEFAVNKYARTVSVLAELCVLAKACLFLCFSSVTTRNKPGLFCYTIAAARRRYLELPFCECSMQAQ